MSNEEKDLGIYRLAYDKDAREWVIRRDNSTRASARFATKAEAEERIKELSKNQEAGYIKHKKDGKWQKKR